MRLETEEPEIKRVEEEKAAEEMKRIEEEKAAAEEWVYLSVHIILLWLFTIGSWLLARPSQLIFEGLNVLRKLRQRKSASMQRKLWRKSESIPIRPAHES